MRHWIVIVAALLGTAAQAQQSAYCVTQDWLTECYGSDGVTVQILRMTQPDQSTPTYRLKRAHKEVVAVPQADGKRCFFEMTGRFVTREYGCEK